MIFPIINSFPQYWENGMKLSAEHFQHLENSIEDAVRDCRSVGLTANSGFGLLPNSTPSIVNAHGSSPSTVRVILKACRAILPGGYRVEILPENIQNLQLPTIEPFVEFEAIQGVRYHLFLSINEKKRVPAGKQQTRPIRSPYLSPDYQLECIPQEKLSAAQNLAPNRMKIAEWKNGKILEHYIPPSLTINGHDGLRKWHLSFQSQLGNTVEICKDVINKHRSKDMTRATFCIPIVNFIRSSQGYFNYVLPYQSPIHLAGYYCNLAGLVQGLMETNLDFVRIQLRGGQANNLQPSIRNLFDLRTISLEEMANTIRLMKNFGDALLSTLKSLKSTAVPTPRSGEGKNTFG